MAGPLICVECDQAIEPGREVRCDDCGDPMHEDCLYLSGPPDYDDLCSACLRDRDAGRGGRKE